MFNFYSSTSALLLVALLASCSFSKKTKSPNILLIVADDLGYADLGCFGSDIQTPHLDELANSGIRFSGFHTSPMCSPTRAMLISGNDNHIAGIGAQSRYTTHFGYEGQLSDRVVTIPELLQQAGYHTYMVGKWHLGKHQDSDPFNRGFENTFALYEGAGNHYTNQSALHQGLSTYTENGKQVKWPDGEYSTDFYTDKIIAYIEANKEDNQPFFAYAAYTSPHWPLQVDTSYWHKYRGRYNQGYDYLKEQRLQSLKDAGIIPEGAKLPPSHKKVVPWNSLSEEEQRYEARKMELYAGMVDNLDVNIGRLIAYLKEIGEYENTLIVFMSDNGAAHRDFIQSEKYAGLKEYYNDDYDNMGSYDSYISYGPQWAEAGSSPFRYYKDYATQGGINTPLIVGGAMVNRTNVIHHGLATVMDLAPTFYEMANVSYPDQYMGRKVYPLKGSSMLPFVSGKADTIHSTNYVFGLEHAGNAMVRKGYWKITNFIRPFNQANFALYNLNDDIGEQNDVKAQYPEVYKELMGEWESFVEEVKIQHPTPKTLRNK